MARTLGRTANSHLGRNGMRDLCHLRNGHRWPRERSRHARDSGNCVRRRVLGAGTILKLDQKETIKGLTTAGSIWLAAALGTAAGSGEYALAGAAAIISFLVLAVLGPVEKHFEHRQKLHKVHSGDSDGLHLDAS